MFGMGLGEMVAIGVIALIVIGPEKFPDFAKIVIKTVRDLRGYMDEMKTEVTKELTPLKEELNPLKKEMNSLSQIDPEKYIDSLTGEGTEDESSQSGSSSVHEEDQKVMAAADADAYGEDPYGWQEGEESDYTADKGAYPAGTVSYGEDSEVVDGGEEAEVSESEDMSDSSEEPPTEPDLEVPEDDRIETTDDPTEPDAWT